MFQLEAKKAKHLHTFRETSDEPGASTTAGDLGKVMLGSLAGELEEPCQKWWKVEDGCCFFCNRWNLLGRFLVDDH